MIRGRNWLAALFSAGVLASCVTNHAALEKKPGGGHLGGSGGVSGASAGSAPTAGTGAGPGSGGGHSDDEPAGTSRLTIVNGVVDAPAVVVCLSKLGADGKASPFGEPIAELDYAQSVTLDELTDVDAAQDTLQPFVIAGDLKLIRGMDCEAAIEHAKEVEGIAVPVPVAEAQGGAAGSDNGAAGAASSAGEATSADAGGEGGAAPEVRSAFRVRGLPAIAAGTLNQGRSLLLVANGCLGGATYASPIAERYCGDGYTESTPTVSAVLVNLSRVVAFDHVGMQVVHASLANGALGLGTVPTPPLMGSPASVVSSVEYGQVSPRPASVLSTVADLGSTRKVSVEASLQGTVSFSEPWLQVLTSGGLTELAPTHTYALVISGPRVDLRTVSELWNAPAITAIAVDPEVDGGT